MVPFASFYRGKRVLVTGHTGFVGGWLVAWLKLVNAKVCGYGLPPSSRPNLFDATQLDRGIASVFADIRDRQALANTFADFQPEIVFHSAVAPSTGKSQPDPLDIFTTNVTGTLNVLEEARLTGCARAIVVLNTSRTMLSSSSQSLNNWACSTKTAAKQFAFAFADSFFAGSRTGVAVADFPALIGGGDWHPSSLVGSLVHAMSSGDPIVLRDLPFHCAHVLEAARACMHLAEDLYAYEEHSSGRRSIVVEGNAISEPEFAKKFAVHWGEKPNIEIQLSSTAASDVMSVGENPALRLALSADETIVWTVDWYKTYFADARSAWRTTETQVEEYSRLAGSNARWFNAGSR